MRKRLFASLLLILSLPTMALDTVEVYEPGLSNFEAYRAQAGQSFTNEILVGYGHNQWVNPTLWVLNEGEAGAASSSTMRLLNISTLEAGRFSLDLMPGVELSEEGTGLGALLDIEIGAVFSRWEPYLYFQTADWRAENGLAADSTGLLGLKYLAKDGVELFVGAQRDLSFASGTVLALGANVAMMEALEIILEANRNMKEEEDTVSLGLIYTR